MTKLLPFLWLAACAPVDGALPAGTWGAQHFELRVEADGSAVIEGDCAHGDLGVVDVVEGEIDVAFDWVSEGGPAQDPPEEPDATPAVLTARVTARRLVGTLAAEDGAWEQRVDLRLGREGELFKCL